MPLRYPLAKGVSRSARFSAPASTNAGNVVVAGLTGRVDVVAQGQFEANEVLENRGDTAAPAASSKLRRSTPSAESPRRSGHRGDRAIWRAWSCRRRSGRRSPVTPAGTVSRARKGRRDCCRGSERHVTEGDLLTRLADGWFVPDSEDPSGAIACPSRATAATGAAAPSSAQLRPPKARG